MGDRWAAIEIMGHKQHVGVISEEVFAGTMLLRIDALNRDGSFSTVRYGGAAIFSMRDVTEEHARKAVVGRYHWPCATFREPSALPGACSECGHTREEHEAHAAKRALPPPTDNDDEKAPESEPLSVDQPW